MDLDRLLETGDRCINEEPPACTAYCPLHLDVKLFMQEIENGNFDKAYKIMEKKLPFPRIIGMLCDHPCESVCVRNDKGGSILINELEKVAVYYGYSKPKKGFPVPSLNKKVAVIGSGFMGITACYDLIKKGYNVDLYEKNNRVGEKVWELQDKYLTPEIIEQELSFLNDKKVSIFLNTTVDENKLNDIIKEYNAVFIAAKSLTSLYEADECTFQAGNIC